MTTDQIMAPPPPPKRKPKDSPNKSTITEKSSNVLSQSERYKIAYTEAWIKLPKWKQIAIEDDRKQGIINGRLMNEFIREVERMAES